MFSVVIERPAGSFEVPWGPPWGMKGHHLALIPIANADVGSATELPGFHPLFLPCLCNLGQSPDISRRHSSSAIQGH